MFVAHSIGQTTKKYKSIVWQVAVCGATDAGATHSELFNNKRRVYFIKFRRWDVVSSAVSNWYLHAAEINVWENVTVPHLLKCYYLFILSNFYQLQVSGDILRLYAIQTEIDYMCYPIRRYMSPVTNNLAVIYDFN